MRRSRSAVRVSSERRARTYAVQSRTAALHHRVDGGNVLAPRSALLVQHAASFCRQPVETAFALTGTLDPASLDQATAFEPEQRWIQRRERKRQPAAGAGLDQLADLISVPRARLEQRQDQHLDAALLQFRSEH